MLKDRSKRCLLIKIHTVTQLPIGRTPSSIATLCRSIAITQLEQPLIIYVSSVELRLNTQPGCSIIKLHIKPLLLDLSARLPAELAKLGDLRLVVEVHQQKWLQKYVYFRAFRDRHTRNASRYSPLSIRSINFRFIPHIPRTIRYTCRTLHLSSCKII